MRLNPIAILLLALCGLLAACKEEPAAPDAGDPTAVLDTCDSAEAAANSEDCRLTPEVEREGYVTPQGDVDWYVLDVPEPLPPRALLTIKAAYEAPATPVTLVVNLLKADGITSLGSATDPRPRGAPGTAQVVARLQPPAGPGAGRYFVVVSHDTGADDPAADRKNPYFLKAELTSDADTNEPNDSTPTSVALPACGSATAQGALSTAGDVDLFGFDLTPCAGRTILHLTLSAAPSAAGIRLAYTLDGPDGVVAIDNAANPFTDQKLVTARLAKAGHYTLKVQAYKAPTDLRDPPGDPSFTYQARLSLFPDADTNEGASGNDEPARATDATMSVGSVKRTFTGRLSYVGDVDLFKVPKPAARGRLHWKLRWTDAAGRFDPVPTLQPRDAELYTVTASASDCRATCPNGSADTSSWCSRSQCLWQRRVEEAAANYGNFEGMLQMPASGPVYLKVGYQGSSGADDREYTLTMEMLADTADEASGPHSRQNAIVVNLPNDGTTVLGHGRGELGDTAPNGLDALPRGPLDYDAEDDSDWFEMHFTPLPVPPLPDGGMPEDAGTTVDHALTLAWIIPAADGQRDGERSHDLGMRLHFCADEACTSIKTTQGFLGYKGGEAQVWYPTEDLVDGGFRLPKAYELEQNTGTFSLRPVTCTCIDAQYAASGRFWVELQAHNRASYADAPIRVKMSVGPYPPTVTDDQGRSFTCPVPCQWVAKSVK